MTYRALLGILLGIVPMAAAEKMTWDEFHKNFGNGIDNRGIEVVTKDGGRHRTRMVTVDSTGIRFCDENVRFAKQDIKRIAISNRGRFVNRLKSAARLPVELGQDTCCTRFDRILVTTVMTPAWGYMVVAAPGRLTAEAVALFVPARVIEIEP